MTTLPIDPSCTTVKADHPVQPFDVEGHFELDYGELQTVIFAVAVGAGPLGVKGVSRCRETKGCVLIGEQSVRVSIVRCPILHVDARATSNPRPREMFPPFLALKNVGSINAPHSRLAVVSM